MLKQKKWIRNWEQAVRRKSYSSIVESDCTIGILNRLLDYDLKVKLYWRIIESIIGMNLWTKNLRGI